MFYPNKHHRFNFALMKKIALFVAALLIAVISFGQTVPVQAKTFRITYGSDSYSINLNGDSILIDASDFIWMAKKFGGDTLLFGDGTFMTTAPSCSTGYIKSIGDTVHGSYKFWEGPIEIGASFSTQLNYLSKDGIEIWKNYSSFANQFGTEIKPDTVWLRGSDGTGENTMTMTSVGITSDGGFTISDAMSLNVTTPTTTFSGRINGLMYTSDSTSLADDASVVLTDAIYGCGEVYAFNAGAIDEWAEFIISTDGTVYLKSNSTDVVNTDTDNKLCIFDNGSGVTIRNRLGGTRIIKYIIHH